MRVETVIVGGGPAGASAAAVLANCGREVLLLERYEGARHKVCGEFLSVETQALLAAVGVDIHRLGAVPIERVAIHTPVQSATADLPFRGFSLSRYVLDDALLAQAVRLGARVRRGISVRRVSRRCGSWIVHCGDGTTIECAHLVLATGKVGLRGVDDRRVDTMVGLKMHLAATAPIRHALRSRVELYLLGGGYAGLELVENDVLNFCCLVEREAARQIGADWRRLSGFVAAAHGGLQERLGAASPMWDRMQAVACPEGGYVESTGCEGLFRVGDRRAHIPPFTGDGMAIALATGTLAAGMIARGSPADAYERASHALVVRPLRLADAMTRAIARPAIREALVTMASCFPMLAEAVAQGTRLKIAKAGLTGACRVRTAAGLPSQR